ncbi:DUF4157 domain-containing protein [Micromonospora sp. CPCC 205371]|nr:DUF4157 domain-containing protein [Micromonospora sp. CPCC 205371]
MERARHSPLVHRASETPDDPAVHRAAPTSNGAVARLFGAHTVSQPGDPQEVEADRIADRIAGAAIPSPAGPPLSSAGQPLPEETRVHFEGLLGHDLSAVRVRSAAEPARAVGARAFTVGADIGFGGGEYAPNSQRGRWLLAHELAHTVQESSGVVRRKEVSDASQVTGPKDWTTADREGNTARWQAACLTNLHAVDSSQYVKIVERRDFYKWFVEYTAARGYLTRWALAAWVVANGAHLIADMDAEHDFANDLVGLAGVELQGAMREGNQVIFDNVLPKLKALVDGGPIKDPRKALEWDMRILAEEQTLIQPLYDGMSRQTLEQLDYIARKKRISGIGAWWTDDDEVPDGPHNRPGTVPAFGEGSLLSIRDRWTYGMKLGNQFAEGGTGFDPKRDQLPAVGQSYWNGAELNKVATRTNLHDLDAWLNPNRYSRMGPGGMGASKYLQQIIGRLTPFEKEQVLADRSPDGWAYSTQFAQFSFITDDLIKTALPTEPARQAAVKAFLERVAAERAKVPAYDPGMGIP